MKYTVPEIEIVSIETSDILLASKDTDDGTDLPIVGF